MKRKMKTACVNMNNRDSPQDSHRLTVCPLEAISSKFSTKTSCVMGGCMQVGGRNLQLEEDEDVDCGAGSQITDM